MAKDYFQSEDFKEILNSYEQGRNEGRSIYLDADDFADIADYYLSNDKPADAMEVVEMGLDIHPEDEVLLIVKSAIYIYQRQYDNAEEILADLDEENSDVTYQLAQLQYAKYGNTAEAERIWREWMVLDNGDSPTEEQKRECYIHIISSLVELRGNNDEGEGKGRDMQAVRRWIQEYIDNFQPLGKYDSDVQIADICRENEMADFMCEVLSQVLEERPYLHRGWTHLALAQFITQNYEQALEACDFALAVDADDTDALLTKAHTLTAIGEHRAAKPVFKEYLEKGGEVVQIIPYAEALFQDKENEEAIYQLEWLSTYMEAKKSDVEKQAKESEQEKLSADEKAKQEALADDFYDLYFKIYTDIGDLYHRHEYFEESLAAYCRILEVFPHCSDAYFMQGINLLALRRYAEASKRFAYALQCSDDQILTGIDIALTFALNNFDQFALEVLNAIDQIVPTSTSPYVKNIASAKSLVYLRMGDTEQFLHFFKMACRDTPDLVQKVYEGHFPQDLPISQWGDYAEKRLDELIEKMSKENLHITGFTS